MQPDIIDALVDCGYKGIVIAGTGLGHVNKAVYPALEYARTKPAVQMYMTLQTLWGFVQMHVYETGREILELGRRCRSANMLPEVGLREAGLGPGPAPRRSRGRCKPPHDDPGRRRPDRAASRWTGYLIFQGGVPEMEKFLDKIWW